MFKQDQYLHFVGIGGIGMSGIAEVLLTLGHRVTGSDLKASETTERLEARGAKIFLGHHAAHVDGADVVVVSSAIDSANPEIAAARAQNIPVVPRAEMLAELMRLKWSIAVAGTHGKTTTTALIGTILDSAGVDPTLVIGGRVNSLSSNARLGRGDFLVAEADESDRSFLKLTPTVAVMTNIDAEHMEQYGDLHSLHQAFLDFANKVPFYGAVVACTDHPVIRQLTPHFQRKLVSYGIDSGDYRASHIEQHGKDVSFDVSFQGALLGRVKMELVGEHHVLNALASIAVARHMEISFAEIQKGLAAFQGVARRFQILRADAPMIVDDYAHHPVEVAATFSAARKGWPDRRLLAIIQPHRFSRLRSHFEEFVTVLGEADVTVVMDVYAAGETPLTDWTGERLCQSLRQMYPQKRISFAPKTKEVIEELRPMCQPKDLILFLGAGDVTKTALAFSMSLTSHA